MSDPHRAGPKSLHNCSGYQTFQNRFLQLQYNKLKKKKKKTSLGFENVCFQRILSGQIQEQNTDFFLIFTTEPIWLKILHLKHLKLLKQKSLNFALKKRINNA